jgi:hypothetical protein
MLRRYRAGFIWLGRLSLRPCFRTRGGHKRLASSARDARDVALMRHTYNASAPTEMKPFQQTGYAVIRLLATEVRPV